ncbi:hypothetical protein B0H16DRAFT_822555 [Mycena metata]|uniref:NACHT domain-containing protein n=1 Tax=Mycena metata TaxID=1033252 RepID=A0AAD7NA14_9AGAR|nr:hypothetical protein B0H16DRAFT_822555 [Mycena metata]
MPDGATYNMAGIQGGTGGTGGQGGSQGGPGGRGEGPRFINSNVYVTNPEPTKLQFIKERLAGHVTAQHKFTDQSKSLCAPGTRVEIQADILKWLSPQPGTKKRIFWITGIAGSGKSTLSATVVDTLRKNHTPVAAQFFISRNIPETIDPAKIIPTIAQQLAESFPAAASIIHKKLKNGFPTSRKEQIEALLLAPILELSKSRNTAIILVDALDELQNAAASVKEILESIAPKDWCYLLDNVRLVITSRPEHWADISKSKTLELAVFKQHPLMTDSSVSDIHNFIIARMKKITPDEPGWKNWPHPGELQKLYNKADGLFHYAATALQYIKQQIDEHGMSCQGWILKNLTQEHGLAPLEDLYRAILTSFEDIDAVAQNKQRREARLAGFQHVIGTILVLHKPLTTHQIIALLDNIRVEHFDVGHFLKQMRSVLIPSMTTSFGRATPQMHKSFRDYIIDGHAPAEFCILMGHAHFVTAKSCLEVIVKAGSQSDVVVEYSVQHWHQHLRKAVEVVEESMTREDGRIWDLFGLMGEEAVVDVWKASSWRVFCDVAAVGWQLLEQGADKHRMEVIANIVMKAKAVRAFLCRQFCLAHFPSPCHF